MKLEKKPENLEMACLQTMDWDEMRRSEKGKSCENYSKQNHKIREACSINPHWNCKISFSFVKGDQKFLICMILTLAKYSVEKMWLGHCRPERSIRDKAIHTKASLVLQWLSVPSFSHWEWKIGEAVECREKAFRLLLFDHQPFPSWFFWPASSFLALF